MKKRNKRHSPQKPPVLKLMWAVGISALCALACFFALILIFCAACILAADPHSLLFPTSLAAIYLSSFAAGFSAVLLNERNDKLLASFLGGVSFTFALFLILLPFQNSEQSAHFILKFLGLPLAILGGYCVPKRQSRKKRRK